MDRFLHYQHHRYTPTSPPIPPSHPLNHHHRRPHELLIPTAPAVLSENPILIPSHIPVLVDHDLRHRHHHPIASPYHQPIPNLSHDASRFGTERFDGNPTHRRVVLAPLSSKHRRWQETSRRDGTVMGQNRRARHSNDPRVQEFTPTPKNQEKRKSVFLRIQLPKPNNGDDEIEQLKSEDFDVDSNPNSNSSRGKKRDGSPVEVDISFESNTLVAKAVVPSNSVIDSNAVVSDTCLTSNKNTKTKKRKALVSGDVSFDLQIGKPSTGAVNSTCSPSLVNDTSNPSNFLASQNNVPDSKATNNVQPGKTTSSSLVKKKKIIKKVVKKVVKPNSKKSTQLPENVLYGTVKSTTADKVSIPDSFQSSPREGTQFLEDKKGYVPTLSLGTQSSSQECNNHKDSDTGIKKVGNISKPASSDSNERDKTTDTDDCLDANNYALGLLSMPNTDKITKSLNSGNSEFNHTDDGEKQSCGNEVSLSPGKDSNVGCPQSSADNSINTYLLNIHNSTSADGGVAGSSSNDLIGRSEENITVCDIGNDGIVGKECYESNTPTLCQNAILEENLDIAMPVTSSRMDSCSSSAKPMIQDDPDYLQQASIVKQGSDSELINSEDSATFPLADIVNDAGKQVFPSNIMVSCDSCDTRSFPDSNIPLGYGEKDSNEIEKRKFRTIPKFFPSKMDNMSPDVESPVGLENDVDSTLNLRKDPSTSEFFYQSGQSLDFSSQSSIDGITILNVKTGVSDVESSIGIANVVDTTLKLGKDPSPSEIFYQSVQSSGFCSQSSIDDIPTLNLKTGFSKVELNFGNNSDDDANEVSRLYERKKLDVGYPNFTQSRSEFSDATVATTSCAEVPASLSDKQAQKKEIGLLGTAILSASPSVPYTEDITKLSDGILVRESVESMDLTWKTLSSENLDLQHSSVASHSSVEDLANPNVQFPMLEGEQKENASPLVTHSEDITKFPDNSLGGESFEPMDLTREIVTSVNLELQHSSIASHSLGEDAATPKAQFLMLEGEQEEDANLILPGNTGTGKVVVENFMVGKVKDDLLALHSCMSHPFDCDPQTWHLTDNNSSASLARCKPSVRNVPPEKSNIQTTSYRCKGDSLVRKPTPVSASSQLSVANQLPFGLDGSGKGISSECRVSASDKPNLLKTGMQNALLKWQRLVPVPIDTNLGSGSSPLIMNPSVGCCESATDPKNVIVTNDMPNSSEDVLKYSVTFENRASQVEVNDGNVSSSNAKRTMYIKPTSNQLVATTNFCALSVSTNGATQTACTDGYYKHGKNQLVRTSFVGGTSPTVIMSNWNVSSDGLGACEGTCSRRFTKRQSRKDYGPLSSASLQSGLAAKEGNIPRYVRSGNGTQLIRHPRKRTRIFGYEKVRRSLHTARQRLARKQEYCQFFTRFGQCNKADGKCPYIHDPAKIAVCTKFLNGLCSNNGNCKLTHKVIPERMPDCSYFLLGLCTNRNCPYRHVNVNPKASICGKFLKGYCADGDECRRKHSYVCPTFEATGSCKTGTKCKLYHPKKQGKGRKRKRCGHQNNSVGPCFGSRPIDISEPGMMVAQRQWQQSNNKGGDVADYISFEADEEVAEFGNQSYKDATMCDGDPWDLQHNLDELVRPVLLMKSDFMAQPSSESIQ